MIFDWNKNQIWQAFFDFWKAKLWKKFLRRKFLTLRRLGVNISCIDDSSFLKCTFRIRYQRSLKFLMKLRNWSFLVREISKKMRKFFWIGSCRRSSRIRQNLPGRYSPDKFFSYHNIFELIEFHPIIYAESGRSLLMKSEKWTP